MYLNAGYLRKKSRQDRWQRRYFEATTHYLTYYKVSSELPPLAFLS